LTLDVLTFGEAMIRLSVPVGESLETASRLDVHVAGAELNVATTLARLGRRVAWASRLPDNPLGRRVLGHLRSVGVDDTGVEVVPDERMGLYFVELGDPPRPTQVVYDRKGSAASLLGPEGISWRLLESTRVVHLTGITPALSESCHRAVVETIERARDTESLVTFDVNYRAKLWSPSQAAQVLGELIEEVDLLVSSLEDAVTLFETADSPAQAVADLAGRFGVERVVVTSGATGAWWSDHGRNGHQPSIPVTVVDRLGAGDAFVAGVIDGVLFDDLPTGVATGTALAALALTTHGDQPIADRGQVETMLDGSGRTVDR
jgi:2-dehydro-3-deoxygluconokinase